MNKILMYGLTMLAATGILSACSDDNDSNPELLATPSEFVLNNPAYVNETVDLQNTDSMSLTWSQPQYSSDNVAMPLTYEIQVSPTNSFTVSLDEAEADETGTKKADYASIARTTTQRSYNLLAKDLNELLVQLSGWNETTTPAESQVYIRVNAFVDENGVRLKPTQSNSIALNVNPYFHQEKSADPIIWYMTGSYIGSQDWDNNGTQSIGRGLIPMFRIGSEKYNKKTGTGLTSFTAYFNAETQFKFVLTPGGWDDQLNYTNVDSPAAFLADLDGNNHNIGITTAGYYTIKLNTETKKVTIEPYDGNVTVYPQICVAGSFTEWADQNMTPVWTLAGENHLWSCDVHGGDKLKIKLPGSWDTQWSYKEGLQGSADGDGNLVIPDGDYLLLFNDITGDYMLLAK